MPIPTPHPKDLGPEEPHSTTPFLGPSIHPEQAAPATQESSRPGWQAGSRLPPYLILTDPGMLWKDARTVPGLSRQQCPPGANRRATSTEPKFGVSYNVTGFSKMSGHERQRKIEELVQIRDQGRVTAKCSVCSWMGQRGCYKRQFGSIGES